jgi:hypothetical protein
MVRGVGAHRERQTVAMHYRQDFHAFSALGRSDLGAAALRHHEGCVDKAFFFVGHAAFTQLIGNVGQDAAQNFAATPSLKAAMHCFVVRIVFDRGRAWTLSALEKSGMEQNLSARATRRWQL